MGPSRPWPQHALAEVGPGPGGVANDFGYFFDSGTQIPEDPGKGQSSQMAFALDPLPKIAPAGLCWRVSC